MAVIPPNVGPQAQQQMQPQMQMGYTNPSLLQQQLLQSQLLQQQLMMQQAQQQGQALPPGVPQAPQNNLLNTISDKAGQAVGNKIGDQIVNYGSTLGSSLFGGSAATGASSAAAAAAPGTAAMTAAPGAATMTAAPGSMAEALVMGAPQSAITGAAPTTGAAGAGLTGGAFGSALGIGGLAAGAYTGYQQLNGLKNAINGGDLSLQEQVALALPTFGASFLYNPVKDFFGSSKDKDQIARDAVRAQMKETGFLGADEGDYNITLPDGTVFDIGKDGDNKSYNVDFSREGMGDLVGAVNPLAAIMSGGDAKLNSDFAGYFTNAASQGGDPYANARALYEKAGLDHNGAYSNVWNLFNAGKLDAAKRDAYLNGIDQVFGANAYAKTGPQAAGNFTPQAPGFGIPAPQQPAAPKPEIQKPAGQAFAAMGAGSPKPQTGLLAPLPQNKPTPAGVQLTPGPRPQPMGMSPQAGQLAQQMGAGSGQIQGGPNMIDPRAQQQQLQNLMGIGAKPAIRKPGQTGLLAPLPNQGQGRGPIRLQR